MLYSDIYERERERITRKNQINNYFTNFEFNVGTIYQINEKYLYLKNSTASSILVRIIIVRRDTYTGRKKSACMCCKYYIAMRDVCLVIFSSIRVTASRLASQRESRVIVTIRVIKLLQIEETGDP